VSATSRRRAGRSRSPKPRRLALRSSSMGTHIRAKAARSKSGRPGAAKSKSKSATASPSLKTTFSRHTSLWQIIVPPHGSASSSLHMPGITGSRDEASWNNLIREVIEESASSVCAQAENGGTATSPSMKSSRSRPSAWISTGSGAPSNPADLSPRRRACNASELGFEGRRTKSPFRTTLPACATPPDKVSSTGSVSQGLPRYAAGTVGQLTAGSGLGQIPPIWKHGEELRRRQLTGAEEALHI
jgi:hypothetical protein